jgi:uncharacterized membrane protein
MSWYVWLKWLHIISSTVLFGTGLGIAFFFVRAQRTGNVAIIASVSRDVVLADAIFTATAVIIQPLSGMGLAIMAGYPLSSPWLVLSMVLYCLVGACWLPVLWLQIWMRDLAVAAAATSSPLPPQYKKFYGRWFALGWPAFVGVLAIFYLMVAKPNL